MCLCSAVWSKGREHVGFLYGRVSVLVADTTHLKLFSITACCNSAASICSDWS